MRFSAISLSLLASIIPTALAEILSVTPHEQFSTSTGILGCKIDTDYVAYFPPLPTTGLPDCDNICKKVTYQDRTVYLLHVDGSGGAHDISYNTWNYLLTGHYATEQGQAIAGGGVNMDVSDVDMSFCLEHIKARDNTGKPVLPVSSAHPNFIDSCLRTQPNSWFIRNYQVLNIYTPTCSYGIDEVCSYDTVAHLSTCPHQVGLMPELDEKVVNVQYMTGALIPSLV